MSKWMAGVISLSLIVILSACSGEPAPAAAPKTPEKAAQTPASTTPPANAPAITPAPPAVTPAKPPAVDTPVAEPAAKAATPAPGGPAPKITSPEPLFNFGEVDSEQPVVHDFVVRNEGAATLEIGKVKTSCGCTVAQPSKKTLAPGEETTIATTLTLKGRQGKQAKTITVESNDPETPAYQLKLEGIAVAAINIDPQTVNFGRIADNETHTRSVSIRATKPDLSFKIIEVNSSSMPQLKVDVNEEEPGKSYQLALSLGGDIKEGSVSGRITVRTDDPKHPALNISVYAQVIGDLDVAPSVITLRYSEDAENRQTQYLRVSPGRAKEFMVTDVVTPIPSMKAEIEPRTANDFLIRLSEMPATDELDGKELIIRTNLDTTPEIKVPFKVIRIQTPRPGAIRGADSSGVSDAAAKGAISLAPSATTDKAAAKSKARTAPTDTAPAKSDAPAAQ